MAMSEDETIEFKYSITPLDLVKDEKVKEWEPLYNMGLIAGGETIVIEIWYESDWNALMLHVNAVMWDPQRGEEHWLLNPEGAGEADVSSFDAFVDDVVETVDNMLAMADHACDEGFGFVCAARNNEKLTELILEHVEKMLRSDEKLKAAVEKVRKMKKNAN